VKQHPTIHIKPFGSHAILIEWPNEVAEVILEHILQFESYLYEKYLKDDGWETVPAYNSLLIINRSKPLNFNEFSGKIKTWYQEEKKSVQQQRYLWHLPICYDAVFGIDLIHVSKTLGLSVDELIRIHTNHEYRVYGIGFLPGFMYLGGLPKALELPRRATPRLKVAKGAVGIAGKQTGIYPQESPGGWNIIGNCVVPLFNLKSVNPCFVNVGDKIQYYQISRAEYDLLKIEIDVGIYEPEKTKIDA